MILLENSFYANQSDLATLLGDKVKVADIFYMNFLGFCGLLKIKDTPAMDAYIKKLGKLQLTTMTDTNADWSLSVKIAHDAGVINSVAATNITKFLVNVRNGKIKSADIKDDPIRELIKACRIVQAKPSLRVFSAVNDFVDGKDDLAHCSYRLWRMAKMPEFDGRCKEMLDVITRGAYVNDLLAQAKPIPVAKTTPVSTAPVKAAKSIRGGLSHLHGAAKGDHNSYVEALLHVFKLRGGIHSYLERFGFKDHFDVDRFRKAIMSPEFVVSHDYHVPWNEHPFVQWIRKKDWAAADEVVKILKNKDKQSANVAVAAQVANTAAPAPAAPKPAVVIQTVPDPVVNQDMVKELYLAENDAQVNAVYAKYNLPTDSIKMIGLLRKELNGGGLRRWMEFQVPELLRQNDDSMLNRLAYESHFAKLLLPLSENLCRLPIIMTLKHAAEIKDETGFFNIVRDNTWFARLSYPAYQMMSTHAVDIAIRSLCGTDYAEFFTRHYEFFYKHFSDIPNVFQNWLQSGDPTQRLIWNFIRPFYNKRLSDTNVIADILQGMGVMMSWTTDGNHTNIVVDSTGFDSLPRTIRDLMKVASNVVGFKMEVKQYDKTDLIKARLKKLINEAPDLSYYVDKRNQAIQLFKDIENDKIDISDLFVNWQDVVNFTRLMKGLVGSNAANWHAYYYFFEQIGKASFTYPDINYSAYSTPSFYGFKEFFEHMLSKNKPAAKKAVAYALAFGSTADVVYQDVFGLGNLEFKSEVLMAWMKRKIDGMTAQTHTKIYDEDVAQILTPANLYRYALGFLNSDDMKSAVRAYNDFMRLHPNEMKDAAKYGTPRWENPGFATAWFVPKHSPDYDDAKAKVMQIEPYNMKSAGPNFAKLAREINPDLYTEWLTAAKKKAGNDIRAVVELADLVTPEEMSDLAIVAIKTYTTDQIRDDLKAKGSMTNFLVANAGKMSLEGKKVLLTAMTPALDVVGVWGIRDREQREYINNGFAEILLDVYEKDKAFANKIFPNVARTTRTNIVKRQGETAYIEAIKDDLYKHPIKPDFPLTHARIRDILKYNNIPIRITSSKGIVKTLDDINKAVAASLGKVGDLKISEPKVTEQDLDRETIRINKFRNNKHGNTGIKILKVFDVEFPGNKARIEAFRKAHPKDGTLMPVFHGTGTVAASMILRNGFQIIPQNDGSVAGRMLGNGIYFSNISNKAVQYVGDKGGGITREHGRKGYIFEMEAELGLSPANYRAMGLGNDHIRSPEWAVYDPDNQLRIYRAYYVQIVDMAEVKAIAEKYGEKINENTMKTRFEDFLFETKQGNTVSLFWFMGGAIPTSMTETSEFDSYKAPKNVYAEPFGDGGVIVSVEHSADIEPVNVTVPNSAEWLMTRPEEAELFFSLIKN